MRPITGLDIAIALRFTSGRAMAKAVDIPENVFSQIRCGRRQPTRIEKAAILRVLDLPEDLVFMGADLTRALIQKLDHGHQVELGVRLLEGARSEMAIALRDMGR